MDLTVIGNGVAGSALTRLARERGHRVRLIGGPPSASLAALSVLRVAYLSGEQDAKEAVAFALDEYERAGCEVIRTATVSSSRSATSKVEDDWYAVDPEPYLLAPDERRIIDDAAWTDPETDFTVHATGAAGLVGKTTFGVTFVNRRADALDLGTDGLRIHRYAPYKSADAVAYQDHCRLGSSSSRTLAGARTEAARIMDVATQLGWIRRTEGWVAIVGQRVQRAEVVDPHGEEGKGWAFGGFHRSGWSLAPLRARQLLETLEAESRAQ